MAGFEYLTLVTGLSLWGSGFILLLRSKHLSSEKEDLERLVFTFDVTGHAISVFGFMMIVLSLSRIWLW
jgi:hypothetical protein